MKRKLTTLLFAVCCTLAIHANDFNFYSDNSEATQEQNISSSSDNSGLLTDDASSGLFDGEPELKAPPGGGAPIGGVPVEDGYWAFFLIGTGYLIYKRKQKARVSA